MGGTAVPKKLYYRIGEACRAVDIQPYVLRYWETEFDALAPGKSKSGQRVYTEQELGVIRRIKELLYEEGYTIAGAKKRLQSELDEGRSFASPEVDGELFEGGEGSEGGAEDDVPAVPVESVADADSEPAAAAATEPEWARSETDPPPRVELAPEPESAVAAQDAPVAESDAVPESAPKLETPRRSRSRAKRETAFKSAATVTDQAVEASAENAPTAVAAASPAHGAAPSAVDSALTDRVETLEHGLRRVLAEVRQLRGLLADSGSER